MIETLKTLFRRDLEKLQNEIALYSNEDAIWQTGRGISNSAGNLCLHLAGNLNAYIGAGLAGISYTRQRDLEFSLKNIPRQELVKKIQATMQRVEAGLNTLDEEQMQKDFPVIIWDGPTGMEYTLLHLLTHLNYHLGQVNYHRRLLNTQ